MSDNLHQSISLLNDLRALVTAAKQRAAGAVNAEVTQLYWQVGKRLQDEVLGGQRAAYGKAVLQQLATGLTEAFGRGWSVQQLRHCLQFAEIFTDEEKVSAVRRQLSWTHIKRLIYLDDELKREFYLTMAMQERWSTRVLSERIDAQLYERTAITKQPRDVISRELQQLDSGCQTAPAMLLKDPYVLDFLGLGDSYLEQDLENAILRELQQFLLELGSGFSFVARQYRIQVDDDDYYIDLLFYNRKLKRLVAIDLKIGAFKPEHKGQMELYLRWLAKHEQEADEQPPLGIILCANKKQEQVELLELDQSGIHVAEYLTALPPKEVLQERLQLAILHARERQDRVQEFRALYRVDNV